MMRSLKIILILRNKAASKTQVAWQPKGEMTGLKAFLLRLRRCLIHKQTDNLRAVQILRDHTKIESTVRCLDVDIEDALALAEGTEV